jgi:hypothetical protein
MRWSLRLAHEVVDYAYTRLRFADPFFRLNIGRFIATACRVEHQQMKSQGLNPRW